MEAQEGRERRKTWVCRRWQSTSYAGTKTRVHSRLKLLCHKQRGLQSFSKSELMILKEMEQNKHLPFHLQRRKLGKTKNTLRVVGHPRIGHKAEQWQKKQHLQYVKNSGRHRPNLLSGKTAEGRAWVVVPEHYS